MIAARFSDTSGASATFYRVSETLLQFRKRKGVCPNNGVTGLDTPAEVGGKDQQ